MTSEWVWVFLFSAFYSVCCSPVPQNIGVSDKIETTTEFGPVLFSNEHQTVRGKVKNVNGQDVFVYEGSYYLLHPNGLWQLVIYTADENGFVVKKFELKIPTYATINPKTVGSLLAG